MSSIIGVPYCPKTTLIKTNVYKGLVNSFSQKWHLSEHGFSLTPVTLPSPRPLDPAGTVSLKKEIPLIQLSFAFASVGSGWSVVSGFASLTVFFSGVSFCSFSFWEVLEDFKPEARGFSGAA